MNRRDFLKWGFRSLAALCVLDMMWLEKRFVELKKETFPFRQPNLSILQISDLHLKTIAPEIRDIARMAHENHPDLIALTGDAIDDKHHLNTFREFMGLLPLDIPKVACMGNWDHWSNVNLNELQRVYQEHNTHLLINKNKTIPLRGKKILVTGVDTLVGGQADYIKALQGANPSYDFHVVLNHCPVYSDHIWNHHTSDKFLKPDLILSGHTHGGQINLLGLVPYLPPGCGDYVRGWFVKDDIPMYVSRGIGWSGVPFRFGSPAEITLFQPSETS